LQDWGHETAFLVAVFAFVALWLAGLGLYVVMATMAARRMPEMGIRIALGASPGSIVILMLRSAILLVSGGLLIGTGGALLLSRSWRSVLPDVPARRYHLFTTAARRARRPTIEDRLEAGSPRAIIFFTPDARSLAAAHQATGREGVGRGKDDPTHHVGVLSDCPINC
jgi:ABC-type antimicrobial peptide transport system permease subunit